MSTYTPSDIGRLYDEAVTLICSNDMSDLDLGGETIREIVGLFKTLKVGEEMLIQYLEAIEDEIAENRNPWFAEERMKIAMDAAQTRTIILL